MYQQILWTDIQELERIALLPVDARKLDLSVLVMV